MDSLQYLLAIISCLLALFLVCKPWRARGNWNPKSKGKSPPEPPGALPVLGHLLQMSPKISLTRSLAAMADQYGSVFAIRIGMRKVLVVSNWEAVKECFTTNDKIFSSRPPSSISEYIFYNNAAFGLAPYGPFWRDIRKTVVQELLSSRRLEKLRHVRISEIENSIKELFRGGKTSTTTPIKVLDMREWFEHLVLNIIVRTIAGMRYTDSEVGSERNAQFKRDVKEFFHYIGKFVVSDVIPVLPLKWFDLLVGNIKSMKRVAKGLDACIQIWIDEHNERRMKSESNDEKDFIAVLLSAIKDESILGHPREDVIKATIMSLIIAGYETTSNHLTWLLSLLLNNRHVMLRAQEEIDAKVGAERWVEEYDIQNLVYLEAIIKEALRLYPPGPLSFPRQAMEDCDVGGYRVPKGTQLFVNVWKLHRDPRIWSEPDKFLPERFLNGQSIAMNFDFTFTPFGSGRRICPGIGMATQVAHLTLARLLQGFDITTASNLPVDMTEISSINLHKVTPLEIQLIPRLQNRALYGLNNCSGDPY